MNTFEIDTYRKVRIEMTDEQLIDVIEQRFASVFQNFRIHNGVFQKYYRASNEVMFRWHDHADEEDAFAYKEYCEMMDSIKSLLKRNQ